MAAKNPNVVQFQDLYKAIDESRRENRVLFDQLNTKIDSNYVTRLEFEPVQKIVYGLVALVLTSVVSALILLVIKK